MTNIIFDNLKIFIASMVAVFLMMGLIKLGINPPKLADPLPKEIKQNSFEQILPKLHLNKGTFQIRKQTGFGTVLAYEDVEYQNLSSYLVVDFESGEVLAEKNMSQRLPIASLTKIMTAVVSLDLLNQEEDLTVSQKASEAIPTKMGLVPGQKWPVGALLNALLLTSTNDAAELLKEGVDQKYGNGAFIFAMNEKAKILGLKNSRFDNPQGFDGDNFSSSEDLAILTHFALTNYPLITDIVKKDYQFYPEDKNHRQADLYNWNGLLDTYPGVMGVKIGNTGAAGKTTIVLSQREGKKVLVVSLGAPGILERDLWTAKLLDLGFSKLEIKPINLTEETLNAKYSTWKYWN